MPTNWYNFQLKQPDLRFDDQGVGISWDYSPRGATSILCNLFPGFSSVPLFPHDRIIIEGFPNNLIPVAGVEDAGGGRTRIKLTEPLTFPFWSYLKIYKAFAFSRPFTLPIKLLYSIPLASAPIMNVGDLIGIIFIENGEFLPEWENAIKKFNQRYTSGVQQSFGYSMTPNMVPVYVNRTWTNGTNFQAEAEATIAPHFFDGCGRYTLPLFFYEVWPIVGGLQVLKSFSFRVLNKAVYSQPVPDTAQGGAIFSVVLSLEGITPLTPYRTNVGRLITADYSQEFEGGGLNKDFETPYSFKFPYGQ